MPTPEGNCPTKKLGFAACDAVRSTRQCIAAQVLGKGLGAQMRRCLPGIPARKSGFPGHSRGAIRPDRNGRPK